MGFRRILFWTHLVAGAIAGIVIFVMCVTGVGLAFERQITQMADAHSRAPVQPGPSRMPIDSLLQQLPGGIDRLTSIAVSADPRQPIVFAYGREDMLFVDPYTGKLLGHSSQGVRAFFSVLERWHRALGSELRGRGGAGREVAGAANSIFLLLVLSGIVLWVPRKWTRKQVRAISLFRTNLSGKAALWNIHNVLGIWCFVPLLLIMLTGVVMSYAWATNLLYKLSGSEVPSRPAFEQQHTDRHSRHMGADSHALALRTLFDRAQTQWPDWGSISLRWPIDPGRAVFTLDKGDGGQPDLRAQLTLDPQTAAVRRWEPFSSYSMGRKLRSWSRFLHTGELAGVPGQIIAALATFGGAVLAGTGLWMLGIRLWRSVSARKQYREQPVSVG